MKNSFFPYQGWPTVCIDESGTLFTAASSFRMSHVCPFGKTALFKSTDNGDTWSVPSVVNDTFLDDRDAGIIALGDKKMLLSWFSHPAPVYQSIYSEGIAQYVGPVGSAMLDKFDDIPQELAGGGSFVRMSEDGGNTWGETVRLPVSAPHGPVRLKDGSLFYLGKELYSSDMEQPEQQGAIAAYKSSDGGKSWHRLGICEKPAAFEWESFYEPHAIELPDGTILGMIRAEGTGIYHGFSLYSTVSEDGGKTWSEWVPLNVSGAPPHLLLHSSGAVICSFGRREPPYGERAVVSYDNGKTWDDEYVIDDNAIDRDLGYPASVELADGSILTVYYQKYRDENGNSDPFTSILYTKWKLQ